MEVFNIGLRIGKYELTRKLAEGGFGTLFVAKDTALDRDLVIKFLLPEHANNDQVVQRFLQEGRSLAKIVHPGIVTVYETGEVQGSGTRADGSAYIIMELLQGETLSQRLKRVGRLSVSVAMEVCRQVANALQAAHEQGIVHRDLKPDNIMLVRDPALSIGERAKVLDFGIAKLAKSSATPSNATQDGLVFGTPIYMSPEQAKSTASAGPSSDIYSLGCILFELLVGRPPFDGSMAELIAHHILTSPPVPSTQAPGIPPHLDQVIGAMMAKNPEERPATMKVVEAILEEKRVVASMARRRTLGGAKLITQPPPVAGAQQSPIAALVAAGQPMVANVRTPPIGVPVQVPQQQQHQQNQAMHAPHGSPTMAAPMPMMPSQQQMAASQARTQAPDQALLAGLKTQAVAAPTPAQWPASSAPQPIAQPQTQPAQPEVIKPSHPTTLSAVTGVTTPAPAKKGGKGLYIGLAAVILAGGAIAMVAVTRGGGDTETQPATSPGSDTIAKPDDTKPDDTKSVDTKPVDTKPVDTKPVDTKPADSDIKVVTPTDTQPADTKTVTITSTPTDTKPADTKPTDTKPADTKPADTKPADTKTVTISSTPTDTKPADTKTATKPADTKTVTITSTPTDTKTTTTKPADTKTVTTTTKPGDSKTVTTTTKPGDTKTITTTTKPADTKTTTTKPTDTKTTTTKPTDTKTKPADTTKPKCQGASCQFDGKF